MVLLLSVRQILLFLWDPSLKLLLTMLCHSIDHVSKVIDFAFSLLNKTRFFKFNRKCKVKNQSKSCLCFEQFTSKSDAKVFLNTSMLVFLF